MSNDHIVYAAFDSKSNCLYVVMIYDYQLENLMVIVNLYTFYNS